MAETPSKMVPLGSKAPPFDLYEPKSQQHCSLNELRSECATVVMFICNHCPYVILIRDKLVALAKSYQKKGAKFIAISSNDATHYPDDGPDEIKKIAEKYEYPFPYLYDESQEVALAYQAACTPDFFIYDKDMRCVYRGRFDGARPGNNVPVTGSDLAQALDETLAGLAVSATQLPSVGCNIKWKA